MKIKLIQTGGFMGRTKVAEEDLAAYPSILQQHVEYAFVHTQVATTHASPGAGRDEFNYIVEYNDKSLPLHVIQPTPEFEQLIDRLKGSLHY